MPAGFQCEDVVDVDCDVQVTEGLLREEEIVEEICGVQRRIQRGTKGARAPVRL